MSNYSRRDFLQTTPGLLAMTMAGPSFMAKKKSPLLSFSTLGCPDWTFANIINFAFANNYQGIELRGILKQLDLTKCPEFSSPENIQATKRLLKNKGLKIVDLGSSTALHIDDPTERLKNINEAKRFIDLAHQLDCPYIRVFPNAFPKDKAHDYIIDLIAKGLIELGDYAKKTSVTVLMETHGDVVKTADIQKIMELADHKKIGLVWDVVNMWSVTKEPPAMVYEALKKHILHTHIKDAITTSAEPKYTLLGKGDTPIFEAIDILSKAGYKGYYSFEWEKLWHPELPEPEIALADYSKVMRQHFNK